MTCDSVSLDDEITVGSQLHRKQYELLLDISLQDNCSELGHRRRFWLILSACVILRVTVWLWFADQPPAIFDERDYNQLAIILVQYRVFGFEPSVSTSLRPPLYPFFVATIYEAFGEENWQAVRAVQALISLGTVVLAYRLALAVYSRRIALWAMAIVGFYPSLLVYNSLILTEVLFTFLFCASCLSIVFAFQRKSIALWATAGLIIGLAALTRSIMWLFPPLLALFIIVLDSGTFSRRLGTAFAMCLAFAIIIMPWAIRNTRLQNTLVTIDVMGGRNLMMGNYEHTPLYHAWDAVSINDERAWHQVLRREKPTEISRTQGEIDKLAMRSGLNYIIGHPLQSLQRSAIKFVNFWQLEREIVAGANQGFFGSISKLAVIVLAGIIVAGYIGTAFASVFGMLFCPPSDRRLHYFFLLLIGFICGLHTLTFGHSRYHLPLIPILALYAAAALGSAGEIWQSRGHPKFISALAGCLLLGISWVWEFAWANPDRYFG